MVAKQKKLYAVERQMGGCRYLLIWDPNTREFWCATTHPRGSKGSTLFSSLKAARQAVKSQRNPWGSCTRFVAFHMAEEQVPIKTKAVNNGQLSWMRHRAKG